MNSKTEISVPVRFKVSEKAGEVSGTLWLPDNAAFFMLFAHGAGAGMNHSFMEKMAGFLAGESIGSLRFNFPYTEKNTRTPDRKPVLTDTIVAARKYIRDHIGNIPVLAGGKSMGGRMTSMAASEELLPDILGIVFFGFPLHAPNKPSDTRAEHLFKVKQPMLFLQGSGDKLADLSLLTPVIEKLGSKAALFIVEGGDHSFKVPKKTGFSEDDILRTLATKVKAWVANGFILKG